MSQSVALKSLSDKEFLALQNGDFSGLSNDEFLRVAQVGKRMGALKQSMANIAKDEKSYDPNSGTSGGRQILEGVGGGMQNVGLRAARLLTPESLEGGLTKRIDQQTHEDESMSGKQQFGKFLGETIATAPVAGELGQGVRLLSAAGRAGNAGKTLSLLANAAEGGAAGQLTTDDGAAVGAGAGAAMLPAMRALGKVGKFLATGSRKAIPKDAEALLAHNAELDLGQMNPGGWVDRAIKAAENAPLGVGSAIRGRREAGLRPVIPTLAADMAGMARPVQSLSAREGVDRALSNVERKFKVVDKVGLDKETAAGVTAGRQGAGRAGWSARGEAFDSRAAEGGKRVQNTELAEASVLRNRAAIRKGSEDPDIRKALRLERGAKGSKLGQLQVEAGKPIGTTADIHKPTRTAIEEYRSELQKDLLNSARSKYLPQHERQLLERSLGEELGKLHDKNLTPSKLKSIASKLKQTAREYTQTKSPNEETRRLARAYNRAALHLEKKIERALAEGGKDVGAYQLANKQFGALQPVQDALFKTGATAHGLIDPTKLERALQKSIGKRPWTAGQGGAPRDVTEALKRLQISSFDGGSLQASGLPSQILRAAQGLMGIPLSSKTATKIAQGDHALARSLKNGPRKRKLLRTLAYLHHGVPGSLVEE